MLTWVEIKTAAIHHNIKQFKKLLAPGTLLMPVIKRNAYGHGLLEIAGLMQQESSVNRVCVASLDEANELISVGFKKPIIILSFYELGSAVCNLAIKKRVAFPVYSLDQIHQLSRLGERQKTKIKVHLKIDTGTSRLGVLPSEALKIAKSINQLPYLILEGVWSHFSSSEENALETKRQEKIFNTLILQLKKEGIEPPLKHFACTASTILHHSSHYNAVRVGLGTYGLYPSPACRKRINLKPALSWYTKLIQVKEIPSGAAVSYGMTYRVTRPTTLGVLPVGYSDGYDRGLSSRSAVLVHGQRCPVLGRVCMNLMMIDLTDLPRRPKAGDKATLIGGSGKNHITADELAKQADTINYEIVDRINPLIPRVII